MSTTIVFVTSISAAAQTGATAQSSASKQEKVPVVTAGPDLEADATAWEAPIREVTVFSDRARIRRKARPSLTPGINKLRLPDLPGATSLDTIRVSVGDAKLLRVEAAPIEREKISIEAVEAALAELEVQTDLRLTIEGRLRVLQEELGFLMTLAPKGPVDEQHRQGKPILPLSLDAQRTVLDFFDGRRTSLRAKVRELEADLEKVNEAIAILRRSVALRDLGAFTSQTIRVLVIVEARGASKPELTLEYMVPGARWTPSYDLHYFAKDGALEIGTYGLVTQATGEDWDDVELFLSTAIPGQGIELPELLTWTLGEKGELIPRPRAQAQPVRPPFQAPEPRATEKEIARAIAVEQLSERLALLDALASGQGQGYGATKKPAAPNKDYGRFRPPPPPRPAQKTIDFADDTIEGDLSRPDD
ncbi:mucoidy inhibitor MuiA family protein, partial [Myxococcota bacterium]|nr:mucoidy inhibitor MuiA family protein [Myxococcota bacterium]